MNKNILNTLLVGAATLALASCGENTWNDHFLDGFEGGVDYESAKTGSYALTADDYKAISDLMVAKASTDEEKAEAKAIATNCYFNKYGAFPASVALPPFLTTAAFPYYLASNGSQIDISYAECAEVPAELSALSGALQYKVTSDDYVAAWGSDEDFINAFAPMTSATNKIPGLLTTAFPEAEEGAYAVVNYNESATNPVFSAVEGDAFEGGNYYIIADGNVAAGVLPKAYGYLPKADASVSDGVVTSDQANIYTFEKTDGGFYIKDSQGRYIYMKGTYNNFNTQTDVPADGGVWTVSVASNGLTTITNTFNSKWLQYSVNYTSWGAYDNEQGLLPVLYKATSTKAETRAAVSTDVTVVKNAVYYFNGTKWSVADGVSVLNPADYEAMGVKNNSLSDPETFIPLYLKNKFVYAQEGDQEFVVYNTNKVGLYVFDGSKWALNNNGLENVVGRYSKSDNAWKFTKYIGKATFTAFNEDQLILDRSYLLTYGNVCATPIDKGSNYGYLTVGAVTISGSNIILPSDANAFTFASKATVDGVEYKVPDGKFLLVDSNGRYNYYDGSHASMQVKDAPEISGGAVAAGYCWSATRNSDGSWKIESDLGEGNVRWLVYSKSYNNFAIYNTITENDFAPSLYMMDE